MFKHPRGTTESIGELSWAGHWFLLLLAQRGWNLQERLFPQIIGQIKCKTCVKVLQGECILHTLFTVYLFLCFSLNLSLSLLLSLFALGSWASSAEIEIRRWFSRGSVIRAWSCLTHGIFYTEKPCLFSWGYHKPFSLFCICFCFCFLLELLGICNDNDQPYLAIREMWVKDAFGHLYQTQNLYSIYPSNYLCGGV